MKQDDLLALNIGVSLDAFRFRATTTSVQGNDAESARTAATRFEQLLLMSGENHG